MGPFGSANAVDRGTPELLGGVLVHVRQSQPNGTPRSEPGSNAERRNPITCHISHITWLFIRIFTIYRYLYNILVICSGYYIDVIQIHRFASIDSHALTPAPLGREAPESPSTRAKTEIIGIFHF